MSLPSWGPTGPRAGVHAAELGLGLPSPVSRGGSKPCLAWGGRQSCTLGRCARRPALLTVIYGSGNHLCLKCAAKVTLLASHKSQLVTEKAQERAVKGQDLRAAEGTRERCPSCLVMAQGQCGQCGCSACWDDPLPGGQDQLSPPSSLQAPCSTHGPSCLPSDLNTALTTLGLSLTLCAKDGSGLRGPAPGTPEWEPRRVQVLVPSCL